MDSTAPDTAAEATTLTLLLQELHFAARAQDERVRAKPDDRLSERVHAARVLAERLRRSLAG